MNDSKSFEPTQTQESARRPAAGEETGTQLGADAAGASAPGLREEVTAKVMSVVEGVQGMGASGLSNTKEGIAARLEDIADSVHRSSEQFTGKQDWIAGAIERGASELTSLAASIRDADVGTIVRQVRLLAKRQPALFVGAAMAAGFALARFGKVVASEVSREDLPTMPEVRDAQA